MTRTTITKIATTGLAAGFASLALVAPAEARDVPDGGGPLNPSSGGGIVATDDGTPWMEIGIGALGGLALAGAGVAAAQSVRHRHAVSTS